MPNAHSTLKRLFSLQVPQALYRKLEIRAAEFGMPINTYIVTVLARDLANIKLTDEDERIIAERIIQAVNRRKSNG